MSDISEVVDAINSSFPIDWRAEAAHIAKISYHERAPAGHWHFRCAAKIVAKNNRRDDIFIEPPDPFCECGEKNVPLVDSLGEHYSETCYECAVVSSD